MKNSIIAFQGMDVRRTWHKNEWYFSIVDIVEVLTKSDRPRKYWLDLKNKLRNEEDFEVSDKIGQLKLKASDGKLRETDCANVEAVFRIIQSIPSPNANRFKLWLARVGYERVKEIENPELAQKRMKELYRQKGYSDSWIEKRIRGIAIRQELTEEWKQRGVDDNIGFAILTNEISAATFGKTVQEYKEFKGLKHENLRDHMDDMETVLTMLGEATTTRFTRERDSQDFPKLKQDAQEGGDVAGATRKDIEKRIGKTVVSDENYLDVPEKKKRLSNKKQI